MCAAAECVGKYQFEAELGAGAHGRVVKARDLVLGRTVALKSLRSQKRANADQKALLDEAKTLAQLSHANIVTLYELIEKDGAAFLVMEYVDGAPLSSRLKTGPLPVDDALCITEQLADALAAATALGVVHGDIKPGNIMIDSTGAPRLVDFGLAKFSNRDDALETLSATGGASTSLEGTIPYMAPEAVMGAAVDERTDIFSLGAVLYEMLTGRRAFDASNPGATLNCVLNDTPTRLRVLRPDAPQWVEDLIDAMLQKEPAFRLQSMLTVRERLAARGRRDWRMLAREYGARALRFVRKKRGAPQWLKIGAAVGAIAVTIWAGTIVTRDVAPPVSVRMERGIDLVRHFEKKGAVKEAQDIFGGILGDDPQHAAAQAGLALALIRQYTSMETDPATLRRATAYAEAALKQDPHLALANIAAAWAAEFNSDFDRAHALYDAADSLDPENPLTLEGRGRTFKKQGDYEAALTVLERAIEAYPEERVFYDDYGDMLLRTGQYFEAERTYKKLLSIHPDNTFGYAGLAQALHFQGKMDEAISIIQEGLTVAHNANLYNNLGTYLFYQGRYEQAVTAFERTLEIDGNSHKYFFWANLADAYRWAPNRKPDAALAYQRAIQLILDDIEGRPNHTGLHSRLALYAAKAGDKTFAMSSLIKATKLPVSQPIIFYRAAVTEEIIGNREKAIDMLERAINAGYALNEIANDPELENLRQDLKYQELLTRRGMNDE